VDPHPLETLCFRPKLRIKSVKFINEDKMERELLYIEKVDVVLPGTMIHVIISDLRKNPCWKERARFLIIVKSNKTVVMCQVLKVIYRNVKKSRKAPMWQS